MDKTYIPTYEQAEELLRRYNHEEFHLKHAKIVAGVMKAFAAVYDPEDAAFWEVAGLLHDLDFELYPSEHCIREQEILRTEGIDERLIHAVASHGYELTVSVKPEHFMEKVLYATDELTGLIGAAALMRPSKSVRDMELRSVKKKYKDHKFAAGCSREVIERGAQMLGWDLDRLISETLEAMKGLADALDI